MVVSDQQLVGRLKDLLGEVDLQTTTEKMLRKKLEEEFGEDLADKKLLIREVVTKYLESQQAEEQEDAAEEEEEEAEEEEDRPRKKTGSGGMGSILSEALQHFLGVDSLPRTQVVKKIWEYIKEQNLQDPKDKRKILLDDKLKTIFTAPLTMFTMNKQLSRHVMSSGEAASPSERRSAPKSDRPAKKAKKASGSGQKGLTGFNRPVRLTEELAELTGTSQMSRPDLMKWIYAYVKTNDLQDKSDKRYAVCDEKLRALLGEDRFQLFSFQKLVNRHILKD